MQQNINQQNNELTPEEAFASLGISTRLNEEYLMQQAQAQQEQDGMMSKDTPVSPQNAPEQQEQDEEGKDIDTELSDMEERLSSQISELDMSTELESIKNELNLLKENDNN